MGYQKVFFLCIWFADQILECLWKICFIWCCMLYVNVNACSWKFIGHCMLHWSLHQIQCLSDHTSKSCVSVLGSWKETVNTQLTRCVGHRDKWRANILLLGHDINMLIFTTCLTTRVYKVFISSCKCVSSVRKLNLSR